MQRKAVVISVDDGHATVMPIEKSECVSCSAGCKKKGEPMSVANSRNFALKVGDLVYIAASGRLQAVEGLVSLLFPFVSAVLGYFVSFPLAAKYSGAKADGVRAMFVLGFLFLSTALVFLITRFFPSKAKVEITGVV